MRSVTITGIEDDVCFDCGGDVMLVGAIAEVGEAVDYLIYKVTLTGAEVLDLFAKARSQIKLDNDIVKEHHYELKAYDD